MSRPLFEVLADDWQDLIHSPQARRLLCWSRATVVPSARDLDGVVDHIWAAGPAEADRLLIRLVGRAQDDVAAARLLLHVLRPGLRTLAHQLERLYPHTDPDEELVAIVWEKIRTYPINRRPRAVGANILLDTRKHYRRLVGETEPWVTLDELESAGALRKARPSAEHEVLDAEAAGMRDVRARLVSAATDGTITPVAARIIWRTRIGGEPDHAVAADFAMNVRSLQRRRQRAERRLAQAS
jgi:hypothetical protein